ncbi:hypothetical protein ACHAWF_002846 [Thalassiosira exigua]
MVNGPGTTIAGVLGNVLEWYDFALFGFFSDIIAQVFFPPSDTPATSTTGEYYDGNLLKSFAVYGGAFLMRPFGGMFIGYIGDKYGRKQALVLSLFLMAIPTFVMGLLPSYKQVGALSTVLLIICRLLQGLSVGGQLPASLVYTVEMRPKKRWGLYGSLVMMAANFGWRIPFLSGILIAFVAMYLKIHGEEHHPNAGEYDENTEGDNSNEVEEPVRPKNPLRESFRRENLPALISATLTPMLWGAGFYVSFVWMAIFMDDLIVPPIQSDYCGRVKMMSAGCILLGALGPVMLIIISRGQAVPAFFAQTAIGLFLTMYGGPISAWLVEKFPPKVRLTSASLGYDIAHCTASAFSPLVATILAQNVSPSAPGVIYPFFAVLGLVGMFTATKISQDGGVEDEAAAAVEDMQKEVELQEEETAQDPQVNPIV